MNLHLYDKEHHNTTRHDNILQWLQTLKIVLILEIEIKVEMGFSKTTIFFEKKDYNWGLNEGELDII